MSQRSARNSEYDTETAQLSVMVSPFSNMWEETAVPAKPWPTLKHDVDIDCAIIGGGYTGLSAALHIAEAGSSVCVLEAEEIGSGGSGRNAGAVVPAWPKASPQSLLENFGEADGKAMNDLAISASRDLLPSLVSRFDMDCEWKQDGALVTARTQKQAAALETLAAQWAGAGAETKSLTQADLASYVTDRTLKGGILYAHGSSLNPLSFVRELARAATTLGAAVFENTSAMAIEQLSGKWVVQTSAGQVRANDLIIATNAFRAGLIPSLDTSFIRMPWAMFATGPARELEKAICPGDLPYFDDDPLTPFQIRFDREARLFSGGFAPVANYSNPQIVAALFRRQFSKRFAGLTLPPFTFTWHGTLCITPDFLPKIHNPAPRLWAAQGYSGAGVAMAVALGRDLAFRLTGQAANWPIAPINHFPMRRVTEALAAKVLPAVIRGFSAR